MARPLSPTARAAMLRAARELLASDGLDACTVEEVSRRSGVAKTTIYRHFGSADDLAVDALSEMIEEIDVPDLGSLRADLRAIVDWFLGVVRQDAFPRLFASMLSRAATDPEFKRIHDRAQECRHVPLRLAIQRGIARGEVDPAIELETAMYFVQGPFLAKRLIESGDVTDRQVDALLDLIVRALAPADGPPQS
jgi:AcrR family transcriptional regulator